MDMNRYSRKLLLAIAMVIGACVIWVVSPGSKSDPLPPLDHSLPDPNGPPRPKVTALRHPGEWDRKRVPQQPDKRQ
jgi:hypothetical protein